VKLQTAQKAVTGALQGRRYRAVTAGMVTMIFQLTENLESMIVSLTRRPSNG